MKPSEIVETMLTEVIPNESKWGQLGMNVDGKYCVLGALNKAALGHAYRAQHEWTPEHLAIYDEMRKHMSALTGQTECAITFNDAHGRTYAEVRQVLEKTYVGLLEAGQ